MSNIHEGLGYRYEVSDGPCDECGCSTPCMEHQGKMLCYDHWHAAREREQCWKVIPKHEGGIPPELTDALERYTDTSGSYLEHEAKAWAADLCARGVPSEAVPWPTWTGGRMGHPGYLHRRRKEVQGVLRARGVGS